MTQENNLSKVYVQVDKSGNIIGCDGGCTTPSDLTNWILIDEGHGYKYDLCQSNYFEDGLYTTDFIYKYKLVNGKPVLRSEEEIEAERFQRENTPAPPTQMEQLRADVDYIAAMSGVIL